MDEPRDSASAKRLPHQLNKLSRLPEGSRIQKRALSRPQRPQPSNGRVIYVSSSTPFMAIVKRVRKSLDKACNRQTPSTKGKSLAQRVQLLNQQGAAAESARAKGEVVLMGTGKAIEKTLSVAGWFMGQDDCTVNVRTRTVGTVDDVVVDDDQFGGDESRVRKMSCLEVVVSLK